MVAGVVSGKKEARDLSKDSSKIWYGIWKSEPCFRAPSTLEHRLLLGQRRVYIYTVRLIIREIGSHGLSGVLYYDALSCASILGLQWLG